MATALASLLRERAVRRDLAMTGEITLRGRVLPIGGLKQKMLAAHLAGIKTILIPKRNEKDLVDIPAEVLEQMRVVPVQTMDDVLAEALTDNPRPAAQVKAERAFRQRVAARRVSRRSDGEKRVTTPPVSRRPATDQPPAVGGQG